MMRKILVLISVVSLVACNSSKKATSGSKEKFTIESLEKMDGAVLKQVYKDAEIKEGKDLFEEGTDERPYTILYPGTNDELHITWQDGGRTKIYDLRYSNKGKWKSETGVDVGTTYKELNDLNGKSISFYGFGWDYSGAVVWNGGKLEKSGLRVFLQPGKDHENKFYGDHIIKATSEEIEALDLKVSAIVINYAL